MLFTQKGRGKKNKKKSCNIIATPICIPPTPHLKNSKLFIFFEVSSNCYDPKSINQILRCSFKKQNEGTIKVPTSHPFPPTPPTKTLCRFGWTLQSQMSVHAFVCQQNPPTAWNHHPSSFIVYLSSVILHHLSLILQLLSFSACFFFIL